METDLQKMTDDELIAKFMGLPRWKHDSWDWLMPVVQKINTLYCEAFQNDTVVKKILIGYKMEEIIGHYIDVVALPISTPIEEVHQNVVKFIRWYNEKP